MTAGRRRTSRSDETGEGTKQGLAETFRAAVVGHHPKAITILPSERPRVAVSTAIG